MDIMRQLFAVDATLVVLTALVTISVAQVDMPFNGYYCYVRCVAKCIDGTTVRMNPPYCLHKQYFLSGHLVGLQRSVHEI